MRIKKPKYSLRRPVSKHLPIEERMLKEFRRQVKTEADLDKVLKQLPVQYRDGFLANFAHQLKDVIPAVQPIEASK